MKGKIKALEQELIEINHAKQVVFKLEGELEDAKEEINKLYIKLKNAEKTLKSLVGDLPDLSKYNANELLAWFSYEIGFINKRCFKAIEDINKK